MTGSTSTRSQAGRRRKHRCFSGSVFTPGRTSRNAVRPVARGVLRGGISDTGRRRSRPGSLAWWCAVPVWSFFALASFVKTGQANWPAPAYVAGFILAVAWVVERLRGSRRHIIAWCLVVNVAVGLAVVGGIHYPAPFRPSLARIAPEPGENDPVPIRKFDITARLVGSKTLSAEVDRLRALPGRKRTRTGLGGTHWTIPGHLGTLCRAAASLFCRSRESDRRHSQYDCWRPNRAAAGICGRTFLSSGRSASHTRAFGSVEPPVWYYRGMPMEV